MSLAGQVSLLATRAGAECKSLWAAVNGKAASAHTHPQADVNGLGTSLAAKINADSTMGFTRRAQAIITGGGTITVSGSSELKWTSRFIVISAGRAADTAPNGYFDIGPTPAAGTVITGVGGAADATVTAAGIPMPGWHALYYIPPANNVFVPANLRMVSYTAASTIPDDWILLANRNGDGGGGVRFAIGVTLSLGETWSLPGDPNVVIVEYTTVVPARPATSAKVIWQGQADPAANALAGDAWWPTA